MGSNRCCSVHSCTNKESGESHKQFYRFPGKSYETERKKKWIDFIRNGAPEKENWMPTVNSRVCSDHFIGGKVSNIKDNPAYIPTIYFKIKEEMEEEDEEVDGHSDSSGSKRGRTDDRREANPREAEEEPFSDLPEQYGAYPAGFTGTKRRRTASRRNDNLGTDESILPDLPEEFDDVKPIIIQSMKMTDEESGSISSTMNHVKTLCEELTQNIQTMNYNLQAITSMVTHQGREMAIIKNQLKQALDLIARNVPGGNVEGFMQDINADGMHENPHNRIKAQLLMTNKADISRVNEMLKNEHEVAATKAYFRTVGGKSPDVVVRNILRKIFSLDLASQCSWEGRKGNYPLKDLIIMQIISEMVVSRPPDYYTEDKFKNIVMKYFKQANTEAKKSNQSLKPEDKERNQATVIEFQSFS